LNTFFNNTIYVSIIKPIIYLLFVDEIVLVIWLSRNLDEFHNLLMNLLCRRDVVIACVGSPLRMDDQAGLIVCDKLLENGVDVVKCEYGLENCVHEIIARSPRALLIIDAVYSNKLSPGDIVLVDEDQLISEDVSPVTTHNIPLKNILSLLKLETGLSEVYLLGIMVKSLDIGLEVSTEVSRSIDYLSKYMVDLYHSCGGESR